MIDKLIEQFTKEANEAQSLLDENHSYDYWEGYFTATLNSTQRFVFHLQKLKEQP